MKGYNFKPRANEDKRIVKFLDIQDNFADTFRYLIEKEIAENGVRDLSLFIPSKRNIDIMRETLGIDNKKFLEQEIDILNDESIIIQKKEKRSNKNNKDVEDLKINKDEILNKDIVKENNSEKSIDEVNKTDESFKEIKGQISVDEFLIRNNSKERENKNNTLKEISITNHEEKVEEDEIPNCYE